MKINEYYKSILSKKQIDSGAHRDAVGGLWDEMGKLQFDFMLSEGLKPSMRFIDVGCGSLRAGIYLIKYLDSGNYFGIDLNQSLLDAGYDNELDAALKKKLPRVNLVQDEHFGFHKFSAEFDFALAQSVFTHLPLNHIRLCLIELAKKMRAGGKFYATFFEVVPGKPLEKPLRHEPGDIVTYPDQDPYHYKLSDFEWCIKGLPWELKYIGDWNHPRAQKMLCFIKG